MDGVVSRSAAPSGTVLVAARDGAVRAWLQDGLARSAVVLQWCGDLTTASAAAAGTVDALVVDAALLAEHAPADALARVQAAGVPVLLVTPAPRWRVARAHLHRAGAEAFDILSPSDPPELAAMRVAAALRVAAAEREEETLRAARLELERDRVVIQLAGAVAHQLKQPLSVAWGYLELLLDERCAEGGVVLDPLAQRYLAEIREAVRTMDDVVNKLQRATVYQTRQYAGALEILNLDEAAVARLGAAPSD